MRCSPTPNTNHLSLSPPLTHAIHSQIRRYLDLHELHRVFTNAKFGRQIDYLEYLGSLSSFGVLPKQERLKAPYR